MTWNFASSLVLMSRNTIYKQFPHIKHPENLPTLRARHVRTVDNPVAHQPRRYAEATFPRTHEVASLGSLPRSATALRQLGSHEAAVLVPRQVEQLGPRNLEDCPRRRRPT